MRNNILLVLATLLSTVVYSQKKVASLPSYDNLIKGSKPVVEKLANGSINWTQQFIEAKGQSVIDTVRFKNKAQAKAMATRGAIVEAQRNLLEIIKGVNIVGETTVEDMITTSDKIQSRVEGVVKGATQVGNAIVVDGLVEVTMRIALYSADGLAPVVADSMEKIIARETKSATPATTTTESSTTNIDSTKKTTPPVTNTTNTGTGSDAEMKPLVFNLNGKKIDPSLFPVITDSTGNLVLDLSKFYDPKKGKFPQYLQLGKDIAKAANFKKGVEVIDIIQNSNGKFVVSDKIKKKINWGKIATAAKKIGKFAMLFL
jgi:hypothetical protein